MRKKNPREKPRQTASRPSFVFEELEPRLLLSADLPVDVPVAYPSVDPADEELFQDINALQTETPAQHTASRELVFVDTDTPDYQLLLDDLTKRSDAREFEVILLENSSDGIAQISDALSQHTELDAVHIISHGSEGAVDLGGGRLEFDSLLANANSISGWSNAFAEHGDLLIYGCNLATSDTGQALVDSLARLTGADVAASDDVTGSAEPGGDWELEYQSGRIETSVAVSAELRRDWTGTLAAPVIDNSGAPRLTDIAEDAINPPGGTVADIITSAGGDRITDVDHGAVEGIAVMGVDDTNGTWEFKVGASSWTAFGAVSDTAAVLLDDAASVRFIPNAGYSGSAGDLTFRAWDTSDGNPSGTTGVNVSINGGMTAYSVDVETATLAVVADSGKTLWISTEQDVPAPSGWNGVASEAVAASEILSLGGPNLAFEPGTGTTDGTFSRMVDFDPMVVAGESRIDALHMVGSDISVGTNAISLSTGDVLFSMFQGSTTTLQNSDLTTLDVDRNDIVLFRPDVPGNYNAGIYSILVDGSDLGINSLSSFTLVEQSTTVGQGGGATTLDAGDILFVDWNAVATDAHILRLQPGTLGDTTTGTVSILVDGNDLSSDFSLPNIVGLDLVEQDTAIGGTLLRSGQILLSLPATDDIGGVSASEHDIVVLDVTTTGTNSVATASLFFDGSKVGLDSWQEDIRGLSISASNNHAPVIISNGGGASANINVSENTTAVATVTATDADLDTATYSISGGADAGFFSIDANSGVLTFVNAPNFEAPADANADNVYDVTVRASDGKGGTDTQAISVTVTDVNEGPHADDDPLAYSAYLNSLSPTGHWRLGEASGGIAVDQTGLNDGNYNGVALGQTGAISADTNTASQFNGIDSYVELAHNPAYLLDNGTVQLWFKTSDVNQSGHLFSKDALGDGTGGHASIYLDGAGHVEVRLQSTTTDYFVTSTLPLVNDQWHHIAFMFGSNGMELYVDGQLQDSDSYTGGLGTTSGGAGNYEPITVGASTQLSASGVATPLEDYFTGFIDEVALFGSVLSADEIQNLYAGGFQNYTLIENNTLNVSATEGVLINDNDPEGNALTAVLVSGPVNVASFTLNPDGSFTYTPNPSFTGTDTFTYKANDGTSDSNTATVTITVNSTPVITSNGGGATANINVTENTTAVTTVTATDADLDTLTYSITGGSDSALFSIDANSGVLTFVNAPNFEAPADANADNVYEVTVQASDGKGGTDTQAISVTVTEVLELVVSSTNATGTGSLHEAILNANANSGVTDTITFNIPGGGPHVINLTGALPAITDTVIIDGTTDPDYAGNPVIRIDGSSAGAGVNGFTFAASSDNSVVRGLMITGFTQHGIQVNSGADGITIANNWIGTTGTGSTGVGNGNTGINIQGANTIVGGTGANDGNVITNNGNEGINVTGTGATGTVIQGNIIGLDADGATGSGNADVGIALLAGAHNTTIGGTTAAERNIISNNFEGIEINSNNNTVQGNYIGTDVTGTLNRGNRSDDGVEIQNGATGNLIGGNGAGEGNLISGNAQNGIFINNANSNTVRGNLIGTDVTGTLDLGNGLDGIQISGDNNVIGGSTAGDRNVISGNGDEGIDINAGATGTIIQGNYVGTNANGTAAIPNGAGGVGNWGGILVGGDNTTVGGSNPGEGNLISGNHSWGIIVESNNNIVQGNLIGTAADGTTALGNTGHGLVAHDYGGGLNNLIGGTVPGAGNVIANNGLDGIAATGNVSATFLGNIILNNAGMGIDLGDDGISSNDAGDIDSGSNALQNFPVITSAELSGTDLTLNGFLDTDGISTQYRIEFFGNAAGTQDATNGEARVYLGAITVSTDGSGDATIANVTLTGITLSVGDYVTATATVIDDPAQIGVDDQLAYGSTSEFATNVAMVAANAVPTTTGIADVMVNEDDPNTVIDLFAVFADAEDADAILVYTITGNTNAGLFSATTIDGVAGTLTLDYAPDAHGTSDITVRATDTGGQWVESTFTVTVTPTNDAPTGSVTIDNMNPTQGDTLTASNSLADADGLSGAISYQWYRGGAAIGGATASTYTTVQADVGNVITVVASYTDDQGTDESVTSAPTAAVTNVNDAPTGSVTISGTPTEDQVLTVANSLADADGLGTIGYQWQRNGIDIGGANSSTYTLTQADVGATISAVASYTDGQGTNESVSSAGVGPVANVNDAPTGTVTITGTPTENQTLTANNTLADADGLGTISYQWQRDGVDISGAASSTYTLTQADVGAIITVVASYTDGQGTNESVSSAGVGPIANSNNAPTGTVTISGSPTEDQTLTAANTLADIDGMGLVSYQWQRNGIDITGATGSIYVLGDADVGSMITVVASYTDGLGASESVSSAGLGPIANVNDAPIARPDGVYGSFDGDDFIQVADHASLQMTNNVTMEAWINHDGTGTGTQIILNKEGEYELALTADTGEIKWALANTGPTWNWYNTGNYITAGEWTHVAVTYDAVAGEVRTYINGALVDTAARSGAIGDVYFTYNDLFIGGRENAVTQRFQGQINEVRLWDSTRTQVEIQTSMDGQLSGGEPGLAGYWRLAEASGGVAVDQSPFGNDGILGGLEGAAATPTYQGYFTSEDTLLTVPAVSGVLANDFDIEGDVLAVTNLDTTGMLGSLVLNPADGSFTYDPRGAFDSLAVGEHVSETFTYTANDGASDSNPVSVTITVTGANDAPTLSAVAKSGNEDTAITFAAADFTAAFSDVDSDGLTQIQITSLPANGSLRLAGVAVNVNDTIAVSQLGNLSFTPHAHWNGSINFDWRGHDGTTWTPTSAAMNLTVNPVNDAPISGMPGGQTTFVNTPLVFSSLDGNSISVTDADGTGATLEITVTASNGMLSLSNTAGLVFTTGNGTNDATMTFTGDVATINAALDGLSFQPNADFEGFATLQLIADDLGNSGAGGALNAVDSIGISVVANASLPANLPPPIDELIVDSPDLPASEPDPVARTQAATQGPKVGQQSDSTTAPVNGNFTDAAGVTIGTSLKNSPVSGELRVFETIASADNDGQQNHAGERALTTRIWNALTDPLVSLQTLSTPPPGSVIWDFLDEMTDQITTDGSVTADSKVYMIGTTATGVTFAFSAGYVSWLLRAGYLSAALLSSAPVWRQFDPLPILSDSDETQPTSGKDHQDSARTDDRRVENIFEPDAGRGPNGAV